MNVDQRKFPSSKALFAFVCLCFASAGCGLCRNEVTAEHKSPNGRSKAVVFQRDCGATTDFSTQVSIIDSTKGMPNWAGNAFRADSDHGIIPVDEKGVIQVRLTWESPRTLVITYPRGARIFLKETYVRGIAIRYVEQD
jgi:hypothetical protein